MVNHREGSQTVIEQSDMTFDVHPDANLFTKSSLTRDLSRMEP